jgi:hypothetical protein
MVASTVNEEFITQYCHNIEEIQLYEIRKTIPAKEVFCKNKFMLYEISTVTLEKLVHRHTKKNTLCASAILTPLNETKLYGVPTLL